MHSGSANRVARGDPIDTAACRSARCREDANPACRVVSLDTVDVDEFSQRAAGWSIQYHVLAAGPSRSRLSLLTTSTLQLGLVDHGMPYSSHGENPTGTLSITVPLDQARPMVFRGLTLGPMQMGLARTGEEFECACRSGARFIVASLGRDLVDRYAADLCGERDLFRHSPDRLSFVDGANRARFIDACRRILRAVDTEPAVRMDGPRATSLAAEKFLEALLVTALDAPVYASEQRRYAVARQAYRYLHDHAAEVASIRELCAATGASYATLERAFRETYGMTPKAMITAMRLAGARRALLHPEPTTTVTNVALRWGFLELGRFSVRYSHRYGEAPSTTLRRAGLDS